MVVKVTQKQITIPQRNYVTRFLDEKCSLSGVLIEKPHLAMHDICAPRVTRYVSQPISLVREPSTITSYPEREAPDNLVDDYGTLREYKKNLSLSVRIIFNVRSRSPTKSRLFRCRTCTGNTA